MENINDEIKDEIKKKRKDGWIETWFSIEALGTNKEVVETSLNTHIEKLKKVKEAFVYEAKFSDIARVENPMKNVKEAYSQIVNVKLFIKNVFALINISMVYGPSSIEIIGPHNKSIDMSELQNIANSVAGIVHQFAAAGVGGIVITPK
jgi:hypothetical protein